MRYITGTKLKGDIYDYRRTKSGEFTQAKHYKSGEILERADKVLTQYSKGEIDVRDKDHKIMAQYIDTFAAYNRDDLLAKLQKKAIFDVKQYLSDNSKSYWQRLFNIDSDKPKFLSAKSLQRKIREYHKINQKLSGGWFHKEKEYHRQNILESEARDYASKFLNDMVLVARQDVPVLKDYFTAFYRQRDVTDIAEALNKISDTPAESYAEKSPSRFAMFMTSAKNGLKNMFKRLKPQHRTATVVSMDRKSWGKVAAVTAIFALAGAAFLKSDSMAKDSKTDNKEIKSKTPDAKQKTAPERVINFTDAAKELTHEQKVWQNFYETKSELHADKVGIDLASTKKQIEAQVNAGIFTMPEGVSVERFIYTHVMYKKYCLESPLEAAINGKQKLSDKQQLAIQEAINLAGENGAGVQEIAAKASKKMGRKLNNHSDFDNASPEMKQKYINAVRQAKALNKHSL